jgi:hypothetical protein
MKFNEELGSYVDTDLQLSPRDISRCLQYRREMPRRIQWFHDKKCVSCGHLPVKDDFKDEFSTRYFRTVRICQSCQDKIF